MAEYIDREALLADFGEKPMVWTYSNSELQERHDWYKYKGIVETQPIADVAPVVRCRDCSMYEAGFCFSRYIGCGSVTPQRSPDDFCSYGERRADNG